MSASPPPSSTSTLPRIIGVRMEPPPVLMRLGSVARERIEAERRSSSSDRDPLPQRVERAKVSESVPRVEARALSSLGSSERSRSPVGKVPEIHLDPMIADSRPPSIRPSRLPPL